MPHTADNRSAARAAGHLPDVVRLVALLAAAAIAFAPSLGGGLIWDDVTYVAGNPAVTEWGGLARIWTTTAATIDFWPVTYTWFWATWHLFGGALPPLHALSWLLHGLNATLLWRLLQRCGLAGAWWAALLFAVHPVQTEAVAWLFQQKTLLATALTLASAWAFVAWTETGRRRQYALALGFYLAGLLAKPLALTLPVVMLAYIAAARRGLAWRQARAIAPFLALAVAAAAINVMWWTVLHPAPASDAVHPEALWARLAGAGRALWFYLGKAAWPRELMFVYPRWTFGEPSLAAFLPLLAWLVVAVGLAWRRRWAPLAALAIYATLLAPVLGFVDIYFMRYSLVADHWQYLALAAPLALAARALSRRPQGRVALGLAALACLWLSLGRARAFASEETLWRDTLAKNPDAWLAHQNLGVLLARDGALMDANVHFLAANRLHPSAEAAYNLGLVASRTGDLAGAVVRYEEALAYAPRSAGDIHHSCGVALSRLRRFAEARRHYEQALALRESAETRYDLGATLEELGDGAGALAEYRRARALETNDPIFRQSLDAAIAALENPAAAPAPVRPSP